jgi:hypothetical protein
MAPLMPGRPDALCVFLRFAFASPNETLDLWHCVALSPSLVPPNTRRPPPPGVVFDGIRALARQPSRRQKERNSANRCAKITWSA